MLNLVTAISKNGGTTYDPANDRERSYGFAVGIYPDRTVKVAVSEFNQDHIDRFMRDNADLLVDPLNYFGAWVDDGYIYFDVSRVVLSKRTAAQLAILNGQQAIYDLSTGQEIDRAHCERYLNALRSV